MSEEKALILQVSKEKMLTKLLEMRENNLTAKQLKKLKKTEITFIVLFNELVYSFFGVSDEQIKEEFGETEIELEIKELVELVARKARPWAIVQQVLAFGVPVAGWLISWVMLAGGGSTPLRSWVYLNSMKKLKEAYGKNYYKVLVEKNEKKGGGK